MAQIVSICEYRERSAVRAGFKLWQRIFKQDFSGRTRLQDLSPTVLRRLAEPGGPCEILYYSLILGFLGAGAGARFETLDKRMKLHALDVHLFLSDQVRFETMRRIGWLFRFGGNRFTLFEMVREFERVRAWCRQNPPLLAPKHPNFGEYVDLVDSDKQVFIRRMFQDALEAFKLAYPS